MDIGTVPNILEFERLRELMDEHSIRKVLYRYCRGIDRRDFDLVRSCYHPDATDDHGAYRGNVDAFIAESRSTLSAYERTMHFLGNILIEVDGTVAASEAYVLAYHRIAARPGKPLRDLVVAARYFDRFERRAGDWRIARRTCICEWTRTDAVPPGWDFSDGFLMGVAGPDDPMLTGELLRD